MKITDEELLKAIWTNQLRLLSTEVLQNYIGGSVGVCGDRDEDYKYSSYEHIRSRCRITDKIGSQQLLKRLRELKSKNLIETYMAIWRQPESFLCFMIKNDKSLEAFKSARQFWLDKGVPTGYSTLDDGRGCANSTKDVVVDSLLPECEKMLMEKYGEVKRFFDLAEGEDHTVETTIKNGKIIDVKEL